MHFAYIATKEASSDAIASHETEGNIFPRDVLGLGVKASHNSATEVEDDGPEILPLGLSDRMSYDAEAQRQMKTKDDKGVNEFPQGVASASKANHGETTGTDAPNCVSTQGAVHGFRRPGVEYISGRGPRITCTSPSGGDGRSDLPVEPQQGSSQLVSASLVLPPPMAEVVDESELKRQARRIRKLVFWIGGPIILVVVIVVVTVVLLRPNSDSPTPSPLQNSTSEPAGCTLCPDGSQQYKHNNTIVIGNTVYSCGAMATTALALAPSACPMIQNLYADDCGCPPSPAASPTSGGLGCTFCPDGSEQYDANKTITVDNVVYSCGSLADAASVLDSASCQFLHGTVSDYCGCPAGR